MELQLNLALKEEDLQNYNIEQLDNVLEAIEKMRTVVETVKDGKQFDTMRSKCKKAALEIVIIWLRIKYTDEEIINLYPDVKHLDIVLIETPFLEVGARLVYEVNHGPDNTSIYYWGKSKKEQRGSDLDTILSRIPKALGYYPCNLHIVFEGYADFTLESLVQEAINTVKEELDASNSTGQSDSN